MGTVAVSWFVNADVGANTILGDIEAVTFNLRTTSGLDSSSATLKIVDASPAEIVVLSSLTVSEDSGNSSYRVGLTSQPTGTVHVIVSIEDFADSPIHLLDGGGQDVGTLTLEFNSENWDSGQEVEFVVADNDYSGENRTEIISHSASGGGYNGAQPKDLSVTIDDDEPRPTIRLSLPETANNSVNEGFQGQLVVTAMLDGPARQLDTFLALALPDNRFTLATGSEETANDHGAGDCCCKLVRRCRRRRKHHSRRHRSRHFQPKDYVGLGG